MIGTAAKRLALGCAFAAATAFAGAEKPNVIPLATSSQWRLVSSQKLGVDAAEKWGGDPAVENEYGVKSLVLRTYTLYPEDETAIVILENASDVSSAYGLFTLYRTDSMTSLQNLPFAEVGKDSALMLRGQTVIRIVEPARAKPATGSLEKPEPFRQFSFTVSQLQDLLVQAGGPGPARDEMRGLSSALPEAGLIEGSEKYLLGLESAKRVLPSFRADLIGFSQGAEARMALYRSGSAKVRVLAVTYPTPQIAHQRFEAMEKLLEVNKGQGATPIYGKLTGSFVILVLDADSAKSATRVLDRFNATGYVTFNQRYPGDTPLVFEVVQFVLANLIFTFILAGFALFAGIAFFGSKYAARKWFPQSSWGQPDDATIIRLNLQ